MEMKQKQVTYIKTIYVANDGTEFDEQDECEAYEMRLIRNSFEFYDEKFKESTLGSCAYAKIKTVEDAVKFLNVCEYEGITTKGIERDGIYMYADNRWYNITEAVSNIYGGATV